MSINEFDNDILQNILSSLDNERDLASASLVCKLWNSLCSPLWKSLFLRGKPGLPISICNIPAGADFDTVISQGADTDWKMLLRNSTNKGEFFHEMSSLEDQLVENLSLCFFIRGGPHSFNSYTDLAVNYRNVAFVGIVSLQFGNNYYPGISEDASLKSVPSHSLLTIFPISCLQDEQLSANCVEIMMTDVVIENCSFISKSNCCIAVRGDGISPVIRNCRFSSSESAAITVRSGSAPLIEGNDIYSCKISGIEVSGSSNPIVQSTGGSAGIAIFSSAGKYTQNDIHDNQKYGVISVASTRHPCQQMAFISDNNVHANKLGLCLEQNTKCEVINNDIHHNKYGVKMYTGGIHSNQKMLDSIQVVRGNKVHRHSYAAICVLGSGPSVVENNEVFDNQRVGIYVVPDAQGDVRANDIHDNKSSGIHVGRNSKCTIERNILRRNAGGIEYDRNSSPAMLDNIVDTDNEVVSPEVQQAVTAGVCTFSTTGVYCYRYRCATCERGPTSHNQGCCVVCAEKCHKGHKLSHKQFRRFYCDCYSDWHTCVAYKPQI